MSIVSHSGEVFAGRNAFDMPTRHPRVHDFRLANIFIGIQHMVLKARGQRPCPVY